MTENFSHTRRSQSGEILFALLPSRRLSANIFRYRVIISGARRGLNSLGRSAAFVRNFYQADRPINLRGTDDAPKDG
jgi:hypothetical protein